MKSMKNHEVTFVVNVIFVLVAVAISLDPPSTILYKNTLIRIEKGKMMRKHSKRCRWIAIALFIVVSPLIVGRGDSYFAMAEEPLAYPPTEKQIRERYEKTWLEPIKLNVPAIASDASIQYDYSIVYVRAPRYGDEGKTTWTEVSHPHRMDPGADLVLLRPDGREEVLVEGGKGSVTDPTVSFDGQWVYYAKFHDLTEKHGRGGGSDIYKIHVPSRKVVKLTGFDFAPNTGAANWSSDFVAHEQQKEHLRHALFNLGPCPLPGGKVMFTSNRHGFRPPSSPGNGSPTLQLFVMDDSDDGPAVNVECVGFMNVANALHPVVLKDGRVMFSSQESQGLRTHLEWGLWTIHPDGTNWNPLVSAFATEGGAVNSFHFQTQLTDSSIVFEEYYVGSNFGMGTLRKCASSPPDGYPMFGPAYRRDTRNPPLRSSRHSNGKGQFVRMPFSPFGIESLTPFAHGSDREATPSVRDDKSSTRVGKFTHPCGAPDNHCLVVWTPGPGHTQMNPQADGGIYMIKAGQPVDEPAQMLLIKNDPRFNEQWPRPLVPYQRTYGVKQPKQIESIENDGAGSPALVAGTPFGLIGTSSLYKRESYPDGIVPEGSSTAIYFNENGDSNRKAWKGLDAVTSHGNGITTNWANQGGDVGLYSNDEIHAVRILLQEPASDIHRHSWFNHAKERMRVLGEIPVRKFTGSQQPLDPDGNPDTSFLAKIPADVPFTFQTIDKNGLVLNMSQTWHQLRPGEIRNDCGGCHAHSQRPTSFKLTAAAKPDYEIFDLTKKTPLVARNANANANAKHKWDAEDETSLRQHDGPLNVEYHRDIVPILSRSCASCHTSTGDKKPAGNLILDPAAPEVEEHGRAWPAAYYRLALDNHAKFGYKPPGWDSWGYYQASRYVRKMQARRSLLMWKVLGRRSDGFTNEDHPSESKPGKGDLVFGGEALDLERNRSRFDIDFVGNEMPPPAAVKAGKAAALSDEDKRTIARWIDLGCPIDFEGSYFVDENRPTLAVSHPKSGANGDVSRILVGMHDAYSGLDQASFAVTADFAVDGVTAGENLASRFKQIAAGVYELNLRQPITTLSHGLLVVSVKDKQGNVTRVERSFSVFDE